MHETISVKIYEFEMVRKKIVHHTLENHLAYASWKIHLSLMVILERKFVEDFSRYVFMLEKILFLCWSPKFHKMMILEKEEEVMCLFWSLDGRWN